MSASIGRGAQNMHTVYIKPALRKAYHRKSGCGSSSSSSDTCTRLNQQQQQQHDHEAAAANNNNNKKCIVNGSSAETTDDVWVPDNRTGIYYPKGQEKVIEDLPSHAAKDYNVNWFSIP